MDLDYFDRKGGPFRLRDTRRLLEWMDCWKLARSGTRIAYDMNKVRDILITDKRPAYIQMESFLNTLKRHLILLHENGYPLVEAHQIKMNPYIDEYGKRTPDYLIEFEFVKPYSPQPINLTRVWYQ